jgi:transposase, IS5 family
MHRKYPNKMPQLELFSKEMQMSVSFREFLATDLGQYWEALPLEGIASVIRQKIKKSDVGRKAHLKLEGGIALMFLKAYTGLSDEKLVARLNTDWAFQMFCFVQFNRTKRIKDKDFVGHWRRWLSQFFDVENISKIQGVLVESWKKDIPNQKTVLMDATCYESHVRHPSDEKLLWESCEWVFTELYKHCKTLGIPRPRFKYKGMKTVYLSYAKSRRKTHKKKKKIHKKLLNLLEQGLTLLSSIIDRYGKVLNLPKKTIDRLKVIQKVLPQQKEISKTGTTAGADRIISLAKPYLRPIKRGKETRSTEFGMKAHLIHVGGICLVEHLSFNAFNEGTRLISAVELHEKHFGATQMLGADGIYPTRKNRKYCNGKNITTSFVPVGRPAKESKKTDTKVARAALNRVRSTAMEGSFGNQKLHYNLLKVKAKKEKTEILWVVISIWAESAVKISNIREAKAKEAKKAKATGKKVKAA